MANKIVLCGIDTSTLPKYSSQEMLEMLLAIKNGDCKMKTKFIYGNLRLVLSVIHRFTNRCNSIDDLFQVGCVGLIKAIDNFDPTLNLKFSTYAVPMVIGEIRRFLRDSSSVRVSRSMRDLAFKILQSREKLSKEKNVEPTLEELAKDVQSSYAQVVCALDAISDPISLYDPIYTDDSDTIEVIDQVSEKNNTAESITENLILKEAMNMLPEKERQVVLMRYYMGKTQIEISNEFGISQAQVSRLEKNALSALKQYI